MDEKLHVEEMIKREFSQLMKSWKLKFHHGWNINEKSFQKNENFIQIKLMNDNSHNGWKAREKKQKNEKIRWHIHPLCSSNF
jgi:hypothetical protein